MARARRDRAGLVQSLELAALADPSVPDALASLEQAVALWSELRSATGCARAEFLAGLPSGDGLQAERADATLRSLGVRSQPLLERLSRRVERAVRLGNAPPVSVQTLGRFQILVDAEPVRRRPGSLAGHAIC